jgi:CHAT domain-containing protein
LHNDLPFAAQEIEAIYNLLPSDIQRVRLQRPTKSEVVAEIGRCSVVHLACHGKANTDPSKSQILFSDWESDPFSVADMAEIKLAHVQLAYISACHGAENRKAGLLDEAIHMVGACQLAGFPTVIGTLWQVPDMHSASVAESVYNAMLRDSKELDIIQAAHGLHFAIRKIRDSELLQRKDAKTSDPMSWAPYIHAGV